MLKKAPHSDREQPTLAFYAYAQTVVLNYWSHQQPQHVWLDSIDRMAPTSPVWMLGRVTSIMAVHQASTHQV